MGWCIWEGEVFTVLRLIRTVPLNTQIMSTRWNSDKETRGSNRFSRLQLEEHACWKTLSTLGAHKQLKLWTDYFFKHIKGMRYSHCPVTSKSNLSCRDFQVFCKAPIQNRIERHLRLLDESKTVFAHKQSELQTLKKCSGFYFWYWSHLSSDADFSELKQQWITS